MKKKFTMPSSYTIVFIALVIVASLSYFVPQSIVDKDTGKIIFDATMGADGVIQSGSGLQPYGIWDVIMAPILGFKSSSGVAIGILCAGGFLEVLNKVGAMEAGIGSLLKKFKGNVLIAIMMFVFSLLGTSFGFWEEITAFAVVIIPLFVVAGYDVMTGLGVLFIGATIGNMASLVNPFSTGAAVAAIGNPELSIGSGIVLRLIIFVALYVVGTAMLIQYAQKVKNNPNKSILNGLKDVHTLTDSKSELPEFTTQRKWSVLVLIIVIIFMILGFLPWEDLFGTQVSNIINAPIIFLANVPVLGDLLGAKHIPFLGTWGFDEFAFLFFFGAFLLKFINKMKEMEFINTFIAGMKDLFGVVVVLAIARGIAILMGNSSEGMSITFIYWISSALSNVPLWIFGVVAIGAYVLIGIFLQSTSGVAGISMPILGSVAAALFVSSSLGSTGGQILLISAFTLGINFMSSIYPGATTMGTLELVNVPYNIYLKFMLKIVITLLVIGALIVSIAPYIGIVS